MTDGLVKKAHLAAALAAGALTFTAAVYAGIVELLHYRAYAAPITPPAAYALKYALYAVAASSLLVIRVASAKLGGKKATPEGTLRSLAAQAVVKAAAGELPAIAGFLLYILCGFRADFYLLAAFCAGLEIYNFPRLAAWEERLRGEFGQL